MNTHYFLNENVLPAFMSFGGVRGYIFTYKKSLPTNIFKLHNIANKNELGSTFPKCLDQYFPTESGDGSDTTDLIFSCGSKNCIMPMCFTEDIVIRCNALNFIQYSSSKTNVQLQKSLETNLLKIVNDAISKPESLEWWLKKIINELPMNSDDGPIKYDKILTTDSLKKKKIGKSLLFITYDFRPNTTKNDSTLEIHETENLIIRTIEDAFENKKMCVYIPNTYNNVVDKIIHQLNEQKLKYHYLDLENTIVTTLENFRKLKINYDLTDCL